MQQTYGFKLVYNQKTAHLRSFAAFGLLGKFLFIYKTKLTEML